MDWDKAKRIFILLLIILNLGLAGLNYIENKKSTLSQAQEKAAYEVLSQNGISLYTNLIYKFPPMRRLLVTVPKYSRDELKRMFFDSEQTTVTVEFGKTILKSDTKTLTIEKNKFDLQILKADKEISEFDKNTAQKIAENYLDSLKKPIKDLDLGTIIEKEDSFTFEFFGVYQGKKVFCNNYHVTVTKNGITKVKGYFFAAERLIGEKKEICSCDEALFTIMKEIKAENKKEQITIDKIELGYDFQDIIENSEEIKLVPCYRIYVLGKEKPYVVNAYTNELKK